ncbi:nuclear transport factor 2 family protein [Pedobacter nyackensis]|uniref:nuclear transport factor 2 family protein n=1 Tax=Pedobacter nyackensis TaxID=475255 RepID=UPI0029314C45|nr:nuclear transport factor 2 family protein [Pedobacter nyackensis]
MNTNEKLIHHFYTSFQHKDVESMQDCYADDAKFSDPVFTDLNATEVRSMWAMLVKNGKDMRVEFKNIKSTENGATAEWDAWYTFSKTGNKVHNQIKASFVIENGKIAQHRDHFNFHKWASQALGLTGKLLGWTSFLRKKISSTARKNLQTFITKKP